MTMEPATDSSRFPGPAAGPGERAQRKADDAYADPWIQGSAEQVISAELARATRFRQPVALVLAELDHYGQGRLPGDARLLDIAMVELTRRVRASVRSSDIVFRWGPQRLMVLATGSGYRSGERLAQMLRRAVTAAEFPTAGPVTISMGVAEPVANERAPALFLRLEQLLERTRDTGAGRVVVDHRGNSDDFSSSAGATPLKLVWLEAYESGHPDIDRQHRHCFELANALIDASFGRNDNPARVAEVLDALLAHCQRHFADEEALLGRLGYGRLAQQQAAHAGLLARAIALRAQAAGGGLASAELLQFLCRDLVAGHILADDRHYFQLLAAGRAPQL
jgi:hemerythrin-like metal-binding protein/diguanylate cyclase (GGDEF)-like protein